MEVQKDLAIVLKSVRFEERHQIVTALTQNSGVKSFLAKNSVHSRRFGTSLSTFSAGEWQYKIREGSDVASLTEVNERYTFQTFKDDFNKLIVASVLNELLIKLTFPSESTSKVFLLHSNALYFLNEIPSVDGIERSFLCFYFLKILMELGFSPELNFCLKCQAPLASVQAEKIATVVSDGGWICSDCATTEFQTQLIDKVDLIDLKSMSECSVKVGLNQLRNIDKGRHVQVFAFLKDFVFFHVPGFEKDGLKSLALLA